MQLPPWPTEAHRTPTGATDQVSKPFSPTALLKQTINQNARQFWPFIEALRRQS
jgi:CheY-like chemotaxis protein